MFPLSYPESCAQTDSHPQKNCKRMYRDCVLPEQESVRATALDFTDGALVDLPRMEVVNDARRANNTHEQHARPVEVLRRHRRAVGPEAPEKGPARVAERDAVDRHAPAAKGPLCVREGLFLVALVRDAANRDDVSAHEGGGREGEHGVEGDGGANIDESKGHGK